MPVPFQCPKCSQTLQAEISWIGQQTQCPCCKNIITIPDLTANSQVGYQINTGYPTNNGNNPSEYFLVKFIDGIIASLRSLPIFNSTWKLGSFFAKIGATSYIFLGIFLFIASCMNAKYTDSAWGAILEGVALFLGCAIIAYVGLYMFKQSSSEICNSSDNAVPVSIINSITILSACACLYYLILGITNLAEKDVILEIANDAYHRSSPRIIDVAEEEGGTIIAYDAFRNFFFFVPVFCAGLSKNIFRINDGTLVQNVKGIFLYFGKNVLIAAPYVWAYCAIFRFIHLLIHFGAKQDKFISAFNFAKNDLPMILIWPMVIYIGFLTFSLILKLIEHRLEEEKSK